MEVKIISHQNVLFEGESKQVVLPGEDGELAVMDFHQSCLCSLRQGQIKVFVNRNYWA